MFTSRRTPSDLEAAAAVRRSGYGKKNYLWRRMKSVLLLGVAVILVLIYLGMWPGKRMEELGMGEEEVFSPDWGDELGKPEIGLGHDTDYDQPDEQEEEDEEEEEPEDDDAPSPNTPITFSDGLPPDDPVPGSLPLGSSILPHILLTSLPPPHATPFPLTSLNSLYPSLLPIAPEEKVFLPMPEKAFAAKWKAPGWFKVDGGGRKELPKVQWEGFGRKGGESGERKRERLERREAVKRGFVFAWQRYKEHAWGHDEIRPVSQTIANPFQNWGATIIDSLETLLIMGLSSEYTLCRPHVNQLDFSLINGLDWARGNRTFVLSDDETELLGEGDVEEEGRRRDILMGTFETGIRYLGGLIGAYDLSGDGLMLERAEDLGKLLGRGFDTPSGLIMPRFDAGSHANFYRYSSVSLAEVGSMTLELTRLSQATSNRWYFDRAQRAIDYLQEVVIPRSTMTPLLPQVFDSNVQDHEGVVTGNFAFGGLADSYYEYLIKQHQLIGGATDQYKDMYAAAMDKAEKELFAEVGVLKGRNTLIIGEKRTSQLILKLEHLTCFAGGMLGLGAKLLGRVKDMAYGQRLTQTCYWVGATTGSGLQPESVTFWDESEARRLAPAPTEEDEQDPDLLPFALRSTPPGSRYVEPRYIGRPETIESVFYMYRITGDKMWQDKGWRMFASWTESCVSKGGYSSVRDATMGQPLAGYGDNMESFVFAETFKYHYLLQSEPDLISLDDYVFTTEAHPIIANPKITPGSQGFWKKSEAAKQDLGMRARGTDAQLWTRWETIRQMEKMKEGQGKMMMAGGKGMGGGGGQPGVRPKPPPQYTPPDGEHSAAGKGLGGGQPGVRPRPPPQYTPPDEEEQDD